MTNFFAEVLGTFLLLLIGNGVVANTVLTGTKGNNSGWLFINFGYAMAVYVAVVVAGPVSGAHLNPAVTIGLAVAGNFSWADVPVFIGAQLIGAALGSAMVWVIYKDHFARTEDKDGKLGVFATGPAIRNLGSNFFSEVVGTWILVIAVLFAAAPEFTSPDVSEVKLGLGALGALPVALVVFTIGMSLGGTTGYAINPARDLMPRIMHTILPIPDKRDSDWGYAWIPVVGPIIGAALAGALSLMLS